MEHQLALQQVLRFKNNLCYDTLVAYVKREITAEKLVTEAEACGLILTFNLQPVVPSKNLNLVRARLVPLLQQFKNHRRMLAYCTVLPRPDLDKLQGRLTEATYFLISTLADLFKEIDLHLPLDPPNNMILARVFGLKFVQINTYILQLQHQRIPELCDMIKENQKEFQPCKEDRVQSSVELMNKIPLQNLTQDEIVSCRSSANKSS